MHSEEARESLHGEFTYSLDPRVPAQSGFRLTRVWLAGRSRPSHFSITPGTADGPNHSVGPLTEKWTSFAGRLMHGLQLQGDYSLRTPQRANDCKCIGVFCTGVVFSAARRKTSQRKDRHWETWE